MAEHADFNPFPGLRPYEAVENHLFFGREEQVDDLIRRLGQNHFLAVVGSSGSGKSSLVRAGLLPALVGGQLTSAGSDWRIAIFRPGSDPIGNLNHALGCDSRVAEADTEVAMHLREAVLRKSSLGLVDVSHQLGLADSEKLLVVVDQFEEIFRFARLREASASDDAAAFVKLLLDCPRRDSSNSVYVVLTMRSDFLGDCSLFEDLPEILNKSQYLVPRMNRDQLRSAIMGPVAVGGARISPALLQQILNEVGTNSDQLPLMQHALMRTWEHWKSRTRGAGPIETEDYAAVGSLANALSDHAEEAYASLPGDGSRILAEKIFKFLTEVGPDNRERRRPTTLSEICKVTGAGRDELVRVIDEFRSAGRSFLTPFADTALEGDTAIDISHESLIRNWRRLWRWCHEEADAVEMYRRLSDAAHRYSSQQGSLWDDPELALALQWRARNNPNPVWAARHDEDFGKTIGFLELSASARDEKKKAEERRLEKKRRAAYRTTVLSLVVALALALLTLYALRQTRNTRVLSRQLSSSSATLLSGRPGQEYEAMAAAIQGIPPDFPDRPGQPAVLNALIGALSAARFSLPLIHPLDVRGGVFSPDGKHIATMCEDGTTHLWDTATGRQLGSWKGQHVALGHWPAAPVFSFDGRLALFSDPENRILTVDATSGRVVHTIEAGPDTDFSGFLPEGPDQNMLLTVSLTGHAILWDTATMKRVHEFRTHDAGGSPDLNGEHYAVLPSHARLVLIWGSKGDVQIFSLPDGQIVGRLPFQTHGILDAEISHNGARVLILDAGGTTRLFEGAAVPGKEAVEKRTIADCGSPRFSPEGDLFLCTHAQTIRLFGPAAQERTLPEAVDSREPSLISASFSDDGKYIVSASHDETARVWSATSGRLLRTLTGHTDAVESAVFSHDGEKVLSVSLDNTARIWNWRGYSFVPSVVLKDGAAPAAPVRAVAVSSDEKFAYVGRGRAELEIWNLYGATLSSRLPLPAGCFDPGEGKVDSILPAPPGDSVVITSGNRACILKPGTNQAIRTLSLAATPVRRIVIAPDGSRLLTIQNGATKLWDAPTGAFVADLGGSILDGVFLPAKGALFTVSKENWTEWDMRTGALRGVRDSFPKKEQPEFARFSPMAKYIVTNDPREGLRLWTLDDRLHPYRRASGFWGPDTNFSFSPDETRVAGVRGHNAQLWPFAEPDRSVVSLTFHTADVLGIIFSPGPPSLVLTFAADNAAWLWGSEGAGIAALRGHTGAVDTAAFFPTSRRVITGSEDGSVRIFTSDLRRLATASACGTCDLLRARPEFANVAECRRFVPGVCAEPN